MRFLTTIYILLLTASCRGQYPFDNSIISPKTNRVVTRIAKVNQLMSSAVYEDGRRPQQYDNFTDLRMNASLVELSELTNHPNGVVRCYAFWALSYIPSANLFPIVLNHIGDTTYVDTQFGCIGGQEKVGDFFINVVTPDYVEFDLKKLTATEKRYLDSILVYTPNSLNAKNNAIYTADLTEMLYTRVRDLVIKENNPTALVTMAKFKKEQDIELISNFNQPHFTFRAISEFPHPAFIPLLIKALDSAVEKGAWSAEWRELYKAIASYKNDTALQLLKVPFTNVRHQYIRTYHIDFVFGAIQSFYTPIYDELLWEMWENEKRINYELYRMLYEKNSRRAFELTKKTLDNADDFYYLNTQYFGEDVEARPLNLIDLMLDTIVVQDRPLAVSLINRNLLEIDVHSFPTFADKALQLRDASFVETLFVRLKNEDNPYVYLKAAKVLIAFGDATINKRIVESYGDNNNLKKGWGGKEFALLLEAASGNN